MISQNGFFAVVEEAYNSECEKEQDYNIPLNLYRSSGLLLSDLDDRVAAGAATFMRLMCVAVDGVAFMCIPPNGFPITGYTAFIRAVLAEARRARTLFPKPDYLALAMAEEVGEVVKACMDYMQKKADTRADIETECVQAAAMVWRLLTEGDPTVGIEPVVEES